MSFIHAPTTTSLLLTGLHDPDNDAAWREFHARYTPIMLAVARRLGLSEADAADVAQEALICFLRDYRAMRYARERGRLRAWLSSLVRYRVLDWFRARRNGVDEVALSAAGEVPTDEDIEAVWDAEQRQELLRQAMHEVRSASRLDEKTIRAFERVAIDNVPAASVATELCMTVEDVYQSKRRVSVRLREVIARLEALYEDAGP